MSTSTSTRKAEQAQAIAYLHESLKPGDTVYCLLRHTSASGMSRVIDLKVIMDRGGKPAIGQIGFNAAKALDMRYDRDKNGIKIGGAGMDMGFAIVNDLASTLFPDGFDCLGADYDAHCPGNDTHGAGVHHAYGGYALRHEWL